MEQDSVTVKTYTYIPYPWAWTIFLLAAGGILFWTDHLVLAIVCVFLSAMAATAHYGIEVNFRDKTYTDFVSVFGRRSGEPEKFGTIDYVFIKTSKKSTTASSMVTSRTFSDDYFDGYIKFDGEEKVYLLSHKKKENVMRVLRALSVRLNVEIADHTAPVVE